MTEEAVTVKREYVVSINIAINVALAETTRLVWAADTFATFETALVRGDGVLDLVACRRASHDVVAREVQTLALPEPVRSATRRIAMAALQAAIDSNANVAEKRLSPLKLKIKPFPLAWLLALPCWHKMVRTADGDSLLFVFADEYEFEQSVGHVAWASPTSAARGPQPAPPPRPSPRSAACPRPRLRRCS